MAVEQVLGWSGDGRWVDPTVGMGGDRWVGYYRIKTGEVGKQGFAASTAAVKYVRTGCAAASGAVNGAGCVCACVCVCV